MNCGKQLIGSRCRLGRWVDSIGMGVLDGGWGGDRRRERALFGVNVGHPIVTNGDFVVYLCKTAWTDRAVVWGGEWRRPMDECIRWGPHPLIGRGWFRGFLPFGLNSVFKCAFKTEMYLTRAWKVDNISVWTMYRRNRYLFFFLKMYFVTRNLLKCNSDFKKKSLQPWREVNAAIATIALPVVRFLRGLATYNSMVLASQLGYFRLVTEKLSALYAVVEYPSVRCGCSVLAAEWLDSSAVWQRTDRQIDRRTDGHTTTANTTLVWRRAVKTSLCVCLQLVPFLRHGWWVGIICRKSLILS